MTTIIGDQLRDYVVGILESDGSKVEREVRVDTKKVDILFVQEDEFVRRSIAVECKNEAKNTSQADLVRIWADYSSLIESKKVNELWVIVRADFSPEARGWASARNNLQIFTLAQLDELRNGFRKYTRSVSQLFSEDGLDTYYVTQSLNDGTSLHEKVMAWIQSDESQPLALLGGYGMGKTSYCRYLVAELGRRYLEDPLSRVPIYIRLSDISREHELEGLVAKTLADRYSIRDYHFHKFSKLNSDGRFVLIFDGFDEMKHALSWSEFKYNFSQINLAVRGRSKVLVAGRPNAFLSDDEHSWALRGAQVSGERVVRIPGAPEYQELQLAAFDDATSKTFLRRYLKARGRKDAGAESWIEERVAEFEALRVREEMLRPVHLKIFADIACDPSIELKDFNVYDLYDIATARIASRDTEKPVRAPLDSDRRLRTIEDVAWYIWDQSAGRSLHFKPTDVPTSFVKGAFEPGTELTVPEMYREIFSGSFVERKFGEQYYFAHRSFLEFFVAKKLAKGQEQLPLGTISRNVNPEVLRFMEEGGLLPTFMRKVTTLAQSFSGELELFLLRAMADFSRTTEVAGAQTSYYLIVRYLSVYDDDVEPQFGVLPGRIAEDLQSDIPEVREGALFFGADFVRSHASEPEVDRVAREIVRGCLRSVNWAARHQSMSEELTMPRLTFSRQNLLEFVILRSARIIAETRDEGHHTVAVDFERVFNDIHATRKPKIVPVGRDPTLDGRSSLSFDFEELATELGSRDQRYALEVLRQGVRAHLSG